MYWMRNKKAIIIGIVVVALILVSGTAIGLANKANEDWETEDEEIELAEEYTEEVSASPQPSEEVKTGATEEATEIGGKVESTKGSSEATKNQAVTSKQPVLSTIKPTQKVKSAVSEGKKYKSQGSGREKIVSNVAKFGLYVRKGAKEFITLKEHKNVYNKDYGCMQDYVEFVGKVQNHTMVLCTVYRLGMDYSEEQITIEHPNREYLGVFNGVTYIYELADGYIDEEQGDLFTDLITDNFGDIENNYEIYK